MKTIRVTITGATPLLIHRFGEAAEVGSATRRVKTAEADDPRAEATKHAYIANDGSFFFSAAAIPSAMGSVGANHKQRGSRKTLRFVVPAAVRMLSDTVTICDENGKPHKDFEVDSRPVTIPATKGRIMRHRPRWNKWTASFDLVVNDDLLDPAKAHELLTEAGMQCGIGDFRPEKRGPFGTFQVTRWENGKA